MRAAVTLLDWIGTRASKALPVGVVLGIGFPKLAEWCQEIMLPALAIPLIITIVRIHWEHQFRYLRRWPLLLALTVWVLLACPVLTWLALQAFPLHRPLESAMILAAAAPPLASGAAIALFLGLDAAVIIVGTVFSMFFVPFVLPPLALLLLGLEIEISLLEFTVRLMALVFGAFLAAFVVKRVLGEARIERWAMPMDGVSVILISVFIVAIMDGVTEMGLQRPGYVALTAAMSFALVIGLQALGTGAFWFLGRHTALAVGLMSGYCNMGLIYLVLGDGANLDLLAFFGLGQIPMFVLPPLMGRLYRQVLLEPRRP